MANNQEFSSVLSKSIAGLQSLLAMVTGLSDINPSPVVLLTSRQYFRSINAKQGSVAMPGLALLLQSMSLAQDRMNTHVTRSRGFKIASNSMQPLPTKNYFLSVVPVDVTVTVLYYSKDLNQLEQVCQSWLYHSQAMNLLLVNTQFDLTVKVELDNQLTIAENIFDDSGEYNVFESTATIRTFVGKVFERYVPNRVSINIGTVSDEVDQNDQYLIADLFGFDTQITLKDDAT